MAQDYAAISLSLLVSFPALASDGDITQVENFIKNIIKVLSGLAGLVADRYKYISPSYNSNTTTNIKNINK
jgi:hypothetical protein